MKVIIKRIVAVILFFSVLYGGPFIASFEFYGVKAWYRFPTFITWVMLVTITMIFLIDSFTQKEKE